MQQIGWVIKYKIKPSANGWRFPNVKVYQSEAIARRYAKGGDVLAAYVYEDSDD